MASNTDGAAPAEVRFDPGSFRDRHSRVMVKDGRIFRVLTEHAHSAWRAANDSGLIDEAIKSGRLIGTRELSHDRLSRQDRVA